MARTSFARAVEAAARGLDDGELRTTRRGLLRGAGAAAVGVAAGGLLPAVARAGGGKGAGPRIAVVGAGLAGLSCAYRLQQAGYAAQVYEASTRIGGRCWTGRGDFAEGQLYEHGGELIDTGHRAVRDLAVELGLTLDDLVAAEAPGTSQLGFFFGKPYTVAQMTADFQPVLKQMKADLAAAKYPTTYRSFTQRGYDLDHMSVYDYLETYVPGGHGSPLGAFLDVAYTIEYGADTRAQSSLNLLYLIGYSQPNHFSTFGQSDERFHVRGGNDQLATILAARLGGQIQTSAPLLAIARLADGTYRLTLGNGSASFQRTFDLVVLALPFSILSAAVDWSAAGFNDVKARAIRELGMGTNTKLHVQFSSRFWAPRGSNGETYTDTGYQNTWEVTRAQAGTSGILVNYTGGAPGLAAGQGSPAAQARAFVRQLDAVLPGAQSQWNGKVARDFWTGYEWTRGSYAYWKVGQYTGFSGAEGETSGRCWFCGEHTSQDFQGYLNGAVDTGQATAAGIIRSL